MLDTLGVAYAEAGRFPDAVATAKNALLLAARTNKAPLIDGLQARIALYESGKPYHQPAAATRPCP